MASDRAATRAADRRRVSTDARHAISVMVTATISDAIVTETSIGLSQPELDADFHDHVHRRVHSMRRRKTPLPDGVDRALVEAVPKALKHPDVAAGAIPPNDDF